MLFLVQFFSFFFVMCTVFISFIVRQFYAHCLRSDSLFYAFVFAPYFCCFAYLCLLSFCFTVFVTFPDYGCLSGGRSGETGSGALAVV